MTPNEVVDVSGSVATTPVPTTLSVPGAGLPLSARINAGAPAPASAEPARSKALIQTTWRTRIAVYTTPSRFSSQRQAAVALPSGPSPRYGAHVCGIFGAAMRMKSDGD